MEFFRETDPQVGYLAFGWFTEGQLLSIPMIIIGNKSDLESKRLVSKEEAANLAKNYNCQHFETSAKNDSGVETAFLELTKFLVAKNQLRVNNPKDIIFTPNGSKIPNTKTCC